MLIGAILRAIRPQQWVKNIFVLAALVFAAGESNGLPWDRLVATLLAVGAFCLGSSTIYLINDICDIESDRKHPEKCKRPIAAGEITVTTALVVAAVCLVGALALALSVGGEPFPLVIVVGGYIALNFLYSWRLKHIVLVDAFCIATGFLLRVQGGALAVGVPVSNWLFLCTLFLALFLALCKRRAEVDLLGDDAGSHRAILREYNLGFLDQMVTLLAACTIVSYTMYTIDAEATTKFRHGELLFWTVPFVVFGLGRYLLLVQTQQGGGSPTRVLLGGDLMFALNGAGWLAVVLVALFT
ncbi:MAG TPA: decaprenyl-phosphate phosphoribosyltransferase [Planctomycetes bacterium]|nr:decaprenyl-phosphate phosphoribosyltransferase [Planctomycetota bacterium]HIL52130.1 decaprenyl-phosphate phosphoribosyltransferase [Planctomycetota bacterium]